MKYLIVLVTAWTMLACTHKSADSQDAGPAPFSYPDDDKWTIFHTQSKATHNSYHKASDVVTDFLGWQYDHLPLDQQAQTEGVRAFEIDIHDENPDAGLLAVFHLGLVDANSTCATFRECITVLKQWSDRHPAHLPLFIQVEPKSVRAPDEMEGLFVLIEKDLRDVWTEDRLITPAKVQAGEATLADGVRMHGWPTLRQSRGKAIVAWDNLDTLRAAYSRNGTSLDGRLMFVDGVPADPVAAVAIRNDPIADAQGIVDALQAGMLVRTRSDEDGVEPAANDRTRLEAALKSGAHFISTDYPEPVPDAGIIYDMQIPGGTPTRCNPITALDAGCTSVALENPAFMTAP